uniref:5'-nucleotidase, cytosolic IAa n=1 Tax=Stegastes partitus TaxID=144197 RepID=A0A3B4YZ15_9TELE
MVKMSLDPVQVMSGQVEELKVAPSSNGDSRGSWEEKEELDQDHLVLTSKPKSPKPENAVTVAVSSRVLFRTEVEQKVFEQKGVEEYLRYQIEHENEPFAPGPAFPFVKALEAVNARLRELYPQSEELFDIVLVTYNHAHVGIRLINTINHHNLFIERFCMTGGSSPIGYLKAWHTNLYLSADADKVREALAEGEHTLLPNSLFLVPSDHRTCLQKLRSLSLCAFANCLFYVSFGVMSSSSLSRLSAHVGTGLV